VGKTNGTDLLNQQILKCVPLPYQTRWNVTINMGKQKTPLLRGLI